MKALAGFSQYRKEKMLPSVFDVLAKSGEETVFHRYDGAEFKAVVVEDMTYDFKFRSSLCNGDTGTSILPKLEIVYIRKPQDRIPLNKSAKKMFFSHNAQMPSKECAGRNYIKNRTLFTLMMEHQVLLLTLYDGTTLRGLVTDFNLYEIRMNCKGGVPVTILRHGILTASTKDGRSQLKADQENFKDWKRSPLFCEPETKPCSDKTVAPQAVIS